MKENGEKMEWGRRRSGMTAQMRERQEKKGKDGREDERELKNKH